MQKMHSTDIYTDVPNVRNVRSRMRCGHNGHNGQALIVSVHIIHQPSAISLHSFRITIKKVLDNYTVKIGGAKKKIYSTEPYNYSLENFAIPQLGRKISHYFTDELPDIYGNANRPLSYRLRAVKVQFLCRYRVGFV